MPLVVPGLQSKDGNSNDDWMSKLMGKKLGDQHDEMVSRLLPPFCFSLTVTLLLSPPLSIRFRANVTPLLDLRKGRPTPATPRPQARRYEDHGLPA
jgi:hypothetical protein